MLLKTEGGNLEIEKNQKYLQKLYLLLGASIFIHYGLVILFSILILINIFATDEYKKIFKDKSLITIGIVLGFSIITSVFYRNILGLIAVPIFLCLVVGRYYTLIVNVEFKNKYFNIFCKYSDNFSNWLKVIINRSSAWNICLVFLLFTKKILCRRNFAAFRICNWSDFRSFAVFEGKYAGRVFLAKSGNN